MSRKHVADDWNEYRMDMKDPHRPLESAEREIAVVDDALAALLDAGVLDDVAYDQERFLAFRGFVRDRFEIPWTAITPRMQRFIYAVNAVTRPRRMIAAGIFCGNTFISNAGVAVGPGACYVAEELVGVEIDPEEAKRAERNVRRIDPTGVARIVADDAVEFVRRFEKPIDLLYLDADGAGGKGKGVYLEILEAGYDRLCPGALVLAHNSVNAADRLSHYLEYVRDPSHMAASVNVILDPEGLEVSRR